MIATEDEVARALFEAYAVPFTEFCPRQQREALLEERWQKMREEFLGVARARMQALDAAGLVVVRRMDE